MLSAIVRFALVRPRLILLAALILLGYGGLTLTRAKYDVFPEFVPAQATVQTEAPGMVAEQVELLITKPLEDVILGANGVADVRSESIQGLSVISITFKEGADPFRARQVVSEQLAQAGSRLPAGASPVVTPLTSSTMDLLKIGFISHKLDLLHLRDLVEWTVRPKLLAVPGVARANIYGGGARRLEVRARPADLLARNLTLADLTVAVQAATAVRGGGFVDTPTQRILIEPHGESLSAAALAKAVITPGGGPPIQIGDVADVLDRAGPAFGDALVMGERGVLLTLSSQYGANTLEVTRAVEAALDELKPALAAEGVAIYPALHRPANFIGTALRNIQLDLLIGAVLILVVLIGFLRNVRAALIAFAAIPLSLMAAVITLDALGQTVNTMSLGGLAVALGVVIDDAVVDLENILRRLRLAPPDADARATILSASVEVRAPIVYATFVLAATVAPILFLTGLQGAFFSPLAFSFLLATFMSLAVALAVTPALALLLLGRSSVHEEPKFLAWLKDRHAAVLRRLFRRPAVATIALVLTGAATIGGFFAFGAELLPAFRERHYVLQLSGPPGASFDWMRDIGARVTKDLLDIPGVATVAQQIGRAEAGEDTWPPNRSEFHVELKQVNGREEDAVLERIRGVLDSYPGVATEALTFLGDRIGESLSGETAAVAIGIYGPDLDVLDRVAAQVASAVSRAPGAADVQVKAPPATPTVRIDLDPVRLSLRGLSATEAYDTIASAFQGQTVSQVTDGQRIADVAVTLSPNPSLTPETIGALLIQGASGAATLGDVADVRATQARASILHDGGRRRQVVTANPATTNVAGFVASAKVEIARAVKLPSGVYLEYAGVAEGQAAASQQVTINVAVAAIGVIALLVLAFGDGRAAALILCGAPFALAGGAVAVAATGGVLSLGALVGFVTLFGIAARNAILLVSHADHLVNADSAPWDVDTVLRATRERVTPILVTALVTALGLLPLALGSGEAGREVEGPMAQVILGGLATSTLATLLFLPPLLLRFRHASVRAKTTKSTV